MPQSRVRFIGSRELHRDLPKVLENLENPNARCVLTIHSKAKAVLAHVGDLVVYSRCCMILGYHKEVTRGVH